MFFCKQCSHHLVNNLLACLDVVITSMKKRRESVVPGSIEETYIEGYPTAPYPCFQAPICYLLPENRKICCLNLFKPCEHDPRTCAAEHNFKNPVTILCVEVPAVSVTTPNCNPPSEGTTWSIFESFNEYLKILIFHYLRYFCLNS